jgi:hypothetical protein
MLRVDVDADRLTQVLAGRLAAIVPQGFQVEASDGMLWYSAGHGRFPGQRGDYRTGTSGTHVRLNLGEAGAAGRVVLGCDPIPLADIEPGGW